ncbi:MAG: GtrA family protein [Pirellulales bacterium]
MQLPLHMTARPFLSGATEGGACAAATANAHAAKFDCKSDRWGPRRGIRALRHRGWTYVFYRYRYLAYFTLIGFASILIELALMRYVWPRSWSWPVASTNAFLVGMCLSFVLNAALNFRVPWSHLLRTFGWFAAISGLSFALNMAVVRWAASIVGDHYGLLRLGTAGVLFLIGYSLHRQFTFDMARNFGIAVYANAAEDVHGAFARVGRNCDHVHVDLIDETMLPSASPVRLSKLDEVCRLWPNTPVSLHVMSRYPRHWVERTWNYVDWYLLHVDAQDDLWELIFDCRQRDKRVGLVWRDGNSLASLMPYLPHLDFVMVLGIRQPGVSGQPMCPRALEVTATLDRLRVRYGFDVMFDGGVKETNVGDIPAKYVVAASAVLQAKNPIDVAHRLRTGAKYERRAA